SARKNLPTKSSKRLRQTRPRSKRSIGCRSTSPKTTLILRKRRRPLAFSWKWIPKQKNSKTMKPPMRSSLANTANRLLCLTKFNMRLALSVFLIAFFAQLHAAENLPKGYQLLYEQNFGKPDAVHD